MEERVLGYDVAGPLALLGMIVVYFSLVAGVLALLDGRAAATFVVLAAVRISLMRAPGGPREWPL